MESSSGNEGLEELTKALKAIDHTQKRYWVDRALAPDILVEEDGADIKLHIPKKLWKAYVDNTFIKGTND